MRLQLFILLLFCYCFQSNLLAQCLGDITPPASTCQNISIYLNNAGIATLNAIDIDNGSTDNCGTPTFFINGQPSWMASCANLGLTTLTLIGSDASGNTDSCFAQVLIQDLLDPQA